MNEDFSDVLNKFSSILKEKNIDLNKIVGGNDKPPTDFNEYTQKNFENSIETENYNESHNQNDFNFDIETIIKIKDILSKINANNNNHRNTLLSALKPYLKDNKKEKLEQYIKIANLLSVLESLNSQTEFKFSEGNYDFILILTLFLLLF